MPSHRAPRKSSSFLSLRREKDKSQPALDSYAAPNSSAIFYEAPSLRPEAYPTIPFLARTLKTKTHRSTSDKTSHFERNVPLHRHSPQSSYAFPTEDHAEVLVAPTTPKQYSRTRSRIGPSGRSHGQPSPTPAPALRFSESSSTHHTETPPQTPVDLNSSQESLERFPAVVAAPIAGVEMMDALVDGMNGRVDDLMLGATGVSNRARFGGIPGHHPLYQPPLPTPPPGVVLGGRRCKASIQANDSTDSDSSQQYTHKSTSRPRRRRPRPTASRIPSPSSTPPPPSTPPAKTVQIPISTANPTTRKIGPAERSPTVVPSIAEIIRAHAPPEAHVRSRPSTRRSSYGTSQGHGSTHQEPEPESESLLENELDLVSRSSIDSVADEVQQTLRSQMRASPRPPPAPPSSFPSRHSTISDNTSIYSPRSDPGAGSSSVYSFSMGSNYCRASPVERNSLNSLPLSKPSSASREVAEYLRSARLTTLLRLTRSPHASHDNPLTVSLSDLGSPTGHPVVVFLGLGCVRHVMGLYDEMAEILNLRLITIDRHVFVYFFSSPTLILPRWGLGRTEPRSKSAKGIIQWASVVEEVLDLLHIDECSVMAHSAGAPYALSFANKVPGRIRGDICLLAPWVGGTESSMFPSTHTRLPIYTFLNRRLQVAQICTQWHIENGTGG